MKRHADLVQLSREHHAALKLALHARRAAESGDADEIRKLAGRVVEFFADELDAHFRIEEQGILVALEQGGEDAPVRRTLDEHHELRTLVSALAHPNATTLWRFADLLASHVRYEERELFPLAEAVLVPGIVTMIEIDLQAKGAQA